MICQITYAMNDHFWKNLWHFIAVSCYTWQRVCWPQADTQHYTTIAWWTMSVYLPSQFLLTILTGPAAHFSSVNSHHTGTACKARTTVQPTNMAVKSGIRKDTFWIFSTVKQFRQNLHLMSSNKINLKKWNKQFNLFL